MIEINNYVVKHKRSETIYDSIDEAKGSFNGITGATDGEIAIARYTAEDDSVKSVIGVYNKVDGEEASWTVYDSSKSLPDWNAEEGEEGYIKNRPFGDVKTCIYENTDVTINSQAGNGYGPLNVSFLNGFTWDTGVTYTVVINDKIYSNLSTDRGGWLADDYTGGYGPVFINANFTLMTAQNADNGSMYFKEPFNNGSVIIFTNFVKKLDENFLPFGIAQTSGYSETDVMTQKAVTDELAGIKSSYVSEITINNIKYIPTKGNVDLGTIGSSDSPFEKGGGTNSAQMSGCTASGSYSVAEGDNTAASGYASHAEGYLTKASGPESHAEGKSTIASGIDSHAEGCDTTANNSCCHAEGQGTTASGYASHAEGTHTTASGNDSHAEGWYTTASGSYSHAEGYNTSATTQSEHASGRYNISLSGSSDFGNVNNTLFTVGNGKYENTHNAFEIRQNGEIYIPDTSAEGEYYEKPMIKLQDALNNIAFVKAVNSGASMNTCNASGQYAVSEGYNTNAIGNRSHAEGDSTQANGLCSHAEGSYTKATFTGAHAEGGNTNATNYYSHAEGAYTTASGWYSHAEGANTKATNYDSHSEGSGTTASGHSSHAEGLQTIAGGYASHAEGIKTVTNNSSEHASGQLNDSLRGNDIFGDGGNTLFTIGNGAEFRDSSYQITATTKHNVLQIMQNGDIYIADTNAEGEYYEKPMIKLQDALASGTGGGGADVDIVQTTGTSETSVMSQKAVTDSLVKIWKGTYNQYEALGEYDDNTIYVIL